MSTDVGTATHVEVDQDGRYLDAPPAALALFGVSLDELREHHVGDFAPAGLGPIHRALFLWVARRGEDFGGGRSTVVTPDGVATPVECTAIERCGDRYRVVLRVTEGEPGAPHTDAIASVLEAWRQAERRLGNGPWDPEFELAKNAAAALRTVYQAVATTKAAATDWATDRFDD